MNLCVVLKRRVSTDNRPEYIKKKKKKKQNECKPGLLNRFTFNRKYGTCRNIQKLTLLY